MLDRERILARIDLLYEVLQNRLDDFEMFKREILQALQ
jgi:hypothetical protein